MNGFVVHPIREAVSCAVVHKMPVLATSLEAEIDRLWEIAQLRVAGGGRHGCSTDAFLVPIPLPMHGSAAI